jgi:DNA-directed RNA polymerase subunit K/omega
MSLELSDEFESDFEEDDEETLTIIDDDDDENEKMEDDNDIDNINEDEFENSEDDDEKKDDDDDDDDDDVDIIEIKEKVKINKSKNITVPFITKYEYPKIISIRAQQIASGSPIYIDITDIKDKTPMNIAEIEFKEGKLNNMIIKRVLPNGNIEIRKLSELKFYSFY